MSHLVLAAGLGIALRGIVIVLTGLETATSDTRVVIGGLGIRVRVVARIVVQRLIRLSDFGYGWMAMLTV